MSFAAALAPPEAVELRRRGVVRSFARGEALMHAEQVPGQVALLESGRVKVCRATEAGREAVLAFRGPGELVGELSALDSEPRSASVVCIEPVRALVLGAEAFRGFLAEHPPAALALLAVLSRRLRDADAKRSELAGLTTAGRVAARLLELCERFGTREGGAIVLDLPLSQEELAGWTGASLESVARVLHTMRERAWIETARRRITVLDPDALGRLAR